MANGERLLVLAPHPDDEALGAGGLMAKAQSLGHEVFVGLFTSGDGFRQDASRYYLSLEVTEDEYLHMGYERQIETTAALNELGVPPQHIYFLGNPDGGLDSLWLTDWDTAPWVSPTTGKSQVPYLTAYRPEVPYRGRNLLALVIDLIQEIQPTRLVLPSAFDTHPDHWGTNAFGTLAALELGRKLAHFSHLPRWGYLVHWPTWPFPLAYRPDMEEQLPRLLLDIRQEPWHREVLSPTMVESKRRALLTYESQVELIKPFLLAFARSSELFAVENQFSPTRSAEELVVRNPRVTWIQKTIGKSNPLVSVRWGRAPSYDYAVVTLMGHLGKEDKLQFSLHPIDGYQRHYEWMVSNREALDDIEVQIRGYEVEVRWPKIWVGEAMHMMAGVQIYRKGKWEGKIPFRVISWEDVR